MIEGQTYISMSKGPEVSKERIESDRSKTARKEV